MLFFFFLFQLPDYCNHYVSRYSKLIFDNFINDSKNKFIFNRILQPLAAMNTTFSNLQQQKRLSYASVNKKPSLPF